MEKLPLDECPMGAPDGTEPSHGFLGLSPRSFTSFLAQNALPTYLQFVVWSRIGDLVVFRSVSHSPSTRVRGSNPNPNHQSDSPTQGYLKGMGFWVCPKVDKPNYVDKKGPLKKRQTHMDEENCGPGNEGLEGKLVREPQGRFPFRSYKNAVAATESDSSRAVSPGLKDFPRPIPTDGPKKVPVFRPAAKNGHCDYSPRESM